MKATTTFHITRLAGAAAVLLTLGLFTIGRISAAGLAFPGALHRIAHLAAFALIAFAFGLGWPLRPAAHSAVPAVAHRRKPTTTVAELFLRRAWPRLKAAGYFARIGMSANRSPSLGLSIAALNVKEC